MKTRQQVNPSTKVKVDEQKKKALVVAITGLDGSGKTTLRNQLGELMEQHGLSVKLTRLPNDRHLVEELLDQSQDKYTDRLLFTVDNRIFAPKCRKWRKSGEFDVVLSQRWFLDSYVHGRVQGYSYREIERMNRMWELPRADILIHLCADVRTAYARICDDPDADKFEYPDYMAVQERETRRAYNAIVGSNKPTMRYFRDAVNIFIDTTNLAPEQTLEIALRELKLCGKIPQLFTEQVAGGTKNDKNN